MNSTDQQAIDKYLAGFYEADLPQADIKKGDPQLAALAQYLESKLGDSENLVIVDYGSGRGVLAHIVDDVWRNRVTPFYIAVDLPGPLDELSLPERVHNRSKKFKIHDFIEQGVSGLRDKHVVTVIRNVLHELDIEQTAGLFWNLISYLPQNSEVYIQDMINLPKVERGRAGWTSEELGNAFGSIGQSVASFEQSSYAGTYWFAMTVNIQPNDSTLTDIGQAFASARKSQLDKLAEKLTTLLAENDTKALEVTSLNFDIGSITAQLKQYEWNRSEGDVEPSVTVDGNIPIVSRDTFAPLDYANLVDGSVSDNSGLVAILSHKHLLDFPRLLESVTSRLFMMGYSQRSLFHNPQNVLALIKAARSGANIKLLVADPEGLAVRLRSNDSIYKESGELERDITGTVESAKRLAMHLDSLLGSEQRKLLELRHFDSNPCASYFIADDKCFVSLYSKNVSGSRGLCMVFRPLEAVPTGYFNTLLEDFEEVWSKSKPVCLW